MPKSFKGNDRRRFLRQSAVLTAGALALPLAAAEAKKPAFKISLAEWSLHRALLARKLDHLDFPRVARETYGIDAIELVNQFFMDKAKDEHYLADFKRRAQDQGVQILLIMCDDEGALGDFVERRQLKAVENHYKWVEAARFLGCHSIRVNAETRGDGTDMEKQEQTADGLRHLCLYAKARGINVLVENHGGLSSNGAWLAAVMRHVKVSNRGTLPDFDNFTLENGREYDRYVGVSEMMPFAKAVSAKSRDFDAQGNCVETDYRKMMKIVLGAGYHGHVGIEYAGDKLSEPDGIRATKKLLEKVRDEQG